MKIKKMFKVGGVKNLTLRTSLVFSFLLLFANIHLVSGTPGDVSFMTKGKYGIFMHYQYRILLGYSVATNPKFPEPAIMTAEGWNRFVDGFDAKGFAAQMAKAKVGWVMFCLDDHYFAWPCCPNSKFSKYTGFAPGQKCSNRDLISDVADALNAKGIKLIVYYAGLNGYMKEPKVSFGLGDTISRGQFNDKSQPSDEARKRRLEVLKEYADRFGTKIAGWWFDTPGKDSYDKSPDDWMAINTIVHNANPKAVISFAQGGMSQMGQLVHGVDDYTGGDTWSKQDLIKLIPKNYPVKDGILWHAKIYCGNVYHGQGDANQFTDQELITWIKTCNEQGGVCTLDWPFIPSNGLIKDFGIRQMVSIKKALK